MLATAEANSFAVLAELAPDAITKLTTAAVHAERGCRPPLHLSDIQVGKKISAVGNITRKSATKIIRLLQFIAADMCAGGPEGSVGIESAQKKITKMVTKAQKIVELDGETLIEAIVGGLTTAYEESETVLPPVNFREAPAAAGQTARGFRAAFDAINYTRSDAQMVATEVSADVYVDTTRPGYNTVFVKQQKAS